MRSLYGFGATKSTYKVCNTLRNASVVLAAGVITTISPEFAAADNKPAKIRSSSFNASAVYQQSEINVLSAGGEKWDVIQAGNMQVRVWGHVDPRRGILEHAGYLLGECRIRTDCDAVQAQPIFDHYVPHRDRKNWHFDRVLSIPTSKIPVSSSSGISGNPIGSRILEGCNSKLDSWGPGTAHSFNMAIPITLSLTTDLYYHGEFNSPHPGDYLGGNWGRSTSFLVKVNCVPRRELASGAKPWKIKTILEDPAGFNQQGSCPRVVRQRTEIIYPRPASATYHIKVNGKKVQTYSSVAQKQGLITTPLGEEPYPYKEQYKIIKETDIELPGGPNGVHAKIKGGQVGPTAYYHVHCPDFRVTSSHLRYDFVQNGECPRTVWETATFRTNGPGTVNYHIKHSGGLVFKTGQVEAKLYNGQYKAVAQRTFAPTDAVEWDMSAIPEGFEDARSGWTKLKLACTKQVEGELAIDTGSDDSLNPAVANWDGDIAIADGNADPGVYPRPAQIVFNVESEQSGNFNYHISCSNGRSFQGSSASFQSGSGKWKAFGAHDFNQTRAMALQCKLREVKDNGKKKFIDKATFQFPYSPANPDLVGGVGGLTDGNRPTQTSTTPSVSTGLKTAPPKRPSAIAQVCIGGKIRYGSCFCPKGVKPVKISRFEYQCKLDRLATPTKPEKPAKPLRTNPKPEKAKLVCVGGKVKGGKCACGKNKLIRKVNARKFQCIAVAKPPRKKQALRVNPKPRNDSAKRTNGSKQKKQVALICKGGKIRNNKCGCPKGYTRKKQGKRKFLCFRPAG